jgi:hypothetical protein
MGFGAPDLPAMLADFGVPVTLGAATTKAIFETPDQQVWRGDGGNAMLASTKLLTLQTGALPGLKAGATVVVEGTPYKVISVQAIEDGDLTHAFVTPP